MGIRTSGRDALVDVFIRQVLQLVSFADLRWPAPDVLLKPLNQCAIFDKCFDDAENDAIPTPKYRLPVLKALVRKLETAIVDPEEDDISDDLVGALAVLMSGASISDTEAAQKKSWVTYSYAGYADRATQDIRVLENRTVISGSGTTGLRTWEAALHFSNYLTTTTDGRARIDGKTILELGAGTGLISMICARSLGAKQVICTDGSGEVVENIKANMAVNGLTEPSMTAGVLKWGWTLLDSVLEQHRSQEIDTVIGADVTYDQRAVPALAATIREIFEVWPAAEVLIAATIRNEDTFAAFEAACMQNTFSMFTVDYDIIPTAQQEQLFYKADVPIRIVSIRNG